MFQNGGVSHNPQGYAYGAAQPYGGLGVLAQMQLMKGFSGSGSSYSSSSSKVSIVKYDDHFKEKGWCAKNLRKPDGSKFSDEEIKKNPPLGLKFGDKDCNVVIPIPSHEAMCATTKAMVSDFLGSGMHADDVQKKASEAISKALLYNYVKECDHSDEMLEPTCFAAPDLLQDMPPVSQREQRAQFVSEGSIDADTYDKAAVGAGGKIAWNFKDNVQRW